MHSAEFHPLHGKGPVPRPRSSTNFEATPAPSKALPAGTEERQAMNYIFWLIGVIVVIAAVLSFLGLR